MSWQFQVVGDIRLDDGNRQLKPERRTAAVLTYLVLEGPTSRSKLAGLLWPEVEERRARNNLVQALRRLKKATSVEFATGDDTLKLTEGLEVDIARLNVLAFQSRYEELPKITGELLPYDYDDLPEFSDWLLLEREKLNHLRREALTSVIRQSEKESNYDAALNYAQTLLHLDVLDEDTYRLIMRLHYIAGNRAEAMKTFERCKSVLQKELGVELSLETHKLAADIGFGVLELTPVRPKETTLPLSILRPPILIGREKEWAQLEEAWQEGKIMFIHGEPGSGKSRLMLDFAASKGNYALVDPRPGDEAVMYSTHARNIRRFLAQHPNEHIEPWVLTELSRLIPELSSEPPPPMKDETDKLRLFEATSWMTFRHQALGIKVIVMDDMQFIDAGSLEMGNYLASKNALAPLHEQLPSLNAFRSNEISPQVETTIHNLVNANVAVLIEVKPLSQEAVGELVESLGVPQFRDLTDRLSKYTGGNPFFILETLKNLLESGGDTAQLPVSNRVSALIQKRLDTLQPTSLKLARVAAVANTDFSPQLAETILKIDALELAESFAELERLQVLRGNAFAHDLIYEATLASIPAPIKTLLHGRVAMWLEAVKANPANIARHYLLAGEEIKAVPFLLEAARQARQAFRHHDSFDFYLQAATIFETHRKNKQAFDALCLALELADTSPAERIPRLVEPLRRLAHQPQEKAIALRALAAHYELEGNLAAVETTVRQALTLIPEGYFLKLEASLREMLAASILYQGRIEVALTEYQTAYQVAQHLGPDAELANAASSLAVVLDHLDCYTEAAKYYQEATQIFEQLEDKPRLILVLNDYGFSLREAGRLHDSLATLEQSLKLLNEVVGIPEDEWRCHAQLGETKARLSAFEGALASLMEAQNIADRHELSAPTIQLSLARILITLGCFDEARQKLETALTQPLREQTRGIIYLTMARLESAREGNVEPYLARAIKHLHPKPESSSHLKLNLFRSTLVSPDVALSLVEEAHRIALEKTDSFAYQIATRTRLSQVQLALANPKLALRHSTEAVQLLQEYGPEFYQGELLLTHYQALKATKNKGANDWLAQTLKWLLDVADNKVPPEYRESFLSHNPVNKALLD
jgi:DNA-binding SARP family transcriptional activator